MEKCGFLEEDPGQFSITRLITLMVVIVAMIFSGIILFVGLKYIKSISDLLTLGTAVLSVFGGMFTLAMGGKLIQKQMENNNSTQPTPPTQ